MDRSDILAKVKELVSDTLECDAAALTLDSRYDDLGADSFDLLDLVTSLESEFDIEFDDDALSELATVGDLIDAIESAL